MDGTTFKPPSLLGGLFRESADRAAQRRAMEALAQIESEAAFVSMLATHSGASVEEAGAAFAAIPQTLRGLVNCPAGCTLLAQGMTIDGTPALAPSIH